VVSLVYLQPNDAWPDKGRLSIVLPALDLPVSRTGVLLHYSPRFSIAPQPGSMRVESDPGPFAEALRKPPVSAARPSTASARSASASETAGAGLQTLVDRYQSEAGVRTVVGSLPVTVTFPSYGPVVFLASELTAEGRAPSVDLDVKRSIRP
jgi:hypothetical protein